MKRLKWKNILLDLGVILGIVLALFAAVRLPVMEVVRKNIQSGIDADAYFYSQVEGFEKHEAAIAGKRQTAERTPEP